MATIVVYGGGFQPFHVGHLSSYLQAKKAFPDAAFYVAASNDTKQRPIPFQDKQFLAQQAGVKDPFVEVKQPINPVEILSKYNPEQDVFIIVRSERDPMSYQKKDGSPAYYQPFVSLDKCAPFGQHGYVLVTKKHTFMVGGHEIYSGTQVRDMYTNADDKGKLGLIKELYPNSNQQLTIKKMLDKYLGAQAAPQVATGDAMKKLKDKQLAEQISKIRPLLKEASPEQKLKLMKLMKSALNESRIMDRDAIVNVNFIGPSGKKLTIASGIPYSMLDKLIAKIRTKGFDITADDVEVSPVSSSQYRRTSQPEMAEAYDHNAPFNAADFNRHMEQLRAREELRKTDPVSAKALDLRGQLPQQSKKKPDDDSMSTSDPRHPQYAYTQAGQHNVDEGEEEALQYATKAHAGQTRSGGDPYISHPVRVANHIRQYKQSHNLDALISAAYLHDTIEDTDTTQEVLHDLFGGLVASLVQELTSDPAQIKKMGKAAYLSHKMAVMSSYGLVIKLADRLDNVKDITTAKTPEWRAKYAKETNQILDYIEKTRALSGTHKKLISLIRAKLAEIDNPQQGVEETALQGKDDLAAKRKALQDLEREPGVDQAAIRQRKLDLDKEARAKGLGEEGGISRRGILKGLGAAMAAGAAGKANAIAGAFPTPSHQAAMYKAAADSNKAQARADAAEKAKADAERLRKNTELVDKEQRVNHHSLAPTNEDYLDEK